MLLYFGFAARVAHV